MSNTNRERGEIEERIAKTHQAGVCGCCDNWNVIHAQALKDAREETIKECRHLVYISASLSDAHYRLGEILSSSPDNQPKGGIIACDDDQGLNS